MLAIDVAVINIFNIACIETIVITQRQIYRLPLRIVQYRLAMHGQV